MDDFEATSDEDVGNPRGWGRETYLLLGSIGVGLVLSIGFLCLDIPGWWRGDTDLFGNYRYADKIRQIEREFTPMERVHARLFPEWLIAQSRGRSPDGGDGDAEEAYRTLRGSLSDQKLRSLVERLRGVVRSKQLGRGDRIVELMDGWNRRLEELEVPFYMRLRTARRGGEAFVFGAFYRRLAQPPVRVGENTHEMLLLRRIDRTNIREPFLGLTRAGAPYTFVVTDRVLDFALRDVLPVVAAGTDESEEVAFSRVPDLGSVATPLAGGVRNELREGLSDERYAALERAARAWVRLDGAVESIRSRRECSQFRLASPRWNGYRARTLDRLEAFASRDKLKSCPSVTYDEADAIRAANGVLESESSQRAFESMVARVSRAIAVHEARHRADRVAYGETMSCENCPERMGDDAKRELSAYAASLAHSSVPHLALFQACKSRPTGAHRRALAVLLERLGTLCGERVPDDVSEKVREIERNVVGRSDAVDFPDGYPERVSLRIW